VALTYKAAQPLEEIVKIASMENTTYPFNENKAKETEVLECIHTDMWGPARVQSAGGSIYFMVLMDGYCYKLPL